MLAARLDGLLPAGSRFDERSAWMGIEEVLHRKQRRRRIAAWSAAASVFLALSGIWFYYSRSRPDEAVFVPQPREQVETTTADPGVQPVELRQKETPAVVKNLAGIKQKAAVIREAEPLHTAANPAPVADASTDSLPGDAEAETALVQPPPQRRFRIAHINDGSLPSAAPADFLSGDEAPQQGWRIPLRGYSGPRAGAEYPAPERRSRGLFSRKNSE